MPHSLPKILISLLFMAFTATAGQAAEIALKTVTLDEFMQGKVLGSINLPIVVPAEFEAANLPKANFGYAYWMRPDDVAASNSNGDLPVQNGYMYGKLTPNVAYDARRDFFIGLEEPESIAKAKQAISNLKIERSKFGKHAVVLLSFSSGDKVAYSMYVASNIDTNVVYIALRPPGNSQEIGDQIWARLKAVLEQPQSGGE